MLGYFYIGLEIELRLLCVCSANASLTEPPQPLVLHFDIGSHSVAQTDLELHM